MSKKKAVEEQTYETVAEVTKMCIVLVTAGSLAEAEGKAERGEWEECLENETVDWAIVGMVRLSQ